jgi:mannose-6-phosphate isomerase-like protein (cupin superfamily)
MTSTAGPKCFRSGEGKTYQLGRLTLTFKTTGPDSGGAYTLCATIEPVGSGAGLHRHPTYDETHIICEGYFDCQLGEQVLKLGPGDMMFVPRGVPHSVKSIGPDTGRELIISSPGGIFDAFIDEVAGSSHVDFKGTAAKYGIEFLI